MTFVQHCPGFHGTFTKTCAHRLTPDIALGDLGSDFSNVEAIPTILPLRCPSGQVLHADGTSRWWPKFKAQATVDKHMNFAHLHLCNHRHCDHLHVPLLQDHHLHCRQQRHLRQHHPADGITDVNTVTKLLKDCSAQKIDSSSQYDPFHGIFRRLSVFVLVMEPVLYNMTILRLIAFCTFVCVFPIPPI